MTHYRSQIRASIRLTLQMLPHFSGFSHRSAWAQNVDVASLPVIAVATPRESKEQSAFDMADRNVTAVVVIKRLGGDALEDELDLDSVHLEAAVLQTMQTLNFGGQLESTEIDLSGSAEQRVGTLTMAFRVFVSTPEPYPL